LYPSPAGNDNPKAVETLKTETLHKEQLHAVSALLRASWHAVQHLVPGKTAWE
jgi:hypothetical protein